MAHLEKDVTHGSHGELSTPLFFFPLSLINTIRFLTYLLYIIEMGGCYSTTLELP